MARSKSRVPVQAYVQAELAERIDELAERLGCSRSQMVEQLLETAVDDNAAIVKVVTNPKVLGLIRTLVGKGKKAGGDARGGGSEGL